MLVKFLDIETTHLNEQIGDIIEIAIVTSIDGGQTISEKWQTKIKPQNIQNADMRSLAINGYSEDTWAQAPTWDDVKELIAIRLRYGQIVCHNASFESRWIHQKLTRDHGYKISWAWVCTKTLSYEHLPWLRSHSLKTLRSVFGLSDIGSHTAMKDTLDCAHIYRKLNRCNFLMRFWYEFRYKRKSSLLERIKN